MADDMEQSQVSPGSEAGAGEANAPALAGGASEPATGGKAGGLTPHLKKAWRALERAGLLPTGSTAAATAATHQGGDEEGPAEPMVDPAPMETGRAFDEAATRVGVAGIVDTADALAVQFVSAAALDVVGESDAAKFAAKVKMSPAIHDGMINAGVEVCRAENVNLPPHATLAALAGGWLYGVFGAVKELKALRSGRDHTPPP